MRLRMTVGLLQIASHNPKKYAKTTQMLRNFGMAYMSQLAQQQNRTPINCWKSHLNDYPQYLVPTLDI